ncbi:MAG: MFS transporter, partial [Acidobacteriota bacterium]
MSFLERFGLHRPELRAWALYDWANSAFVLVVITAVFPIWYKNVPAAGAGLDAAAATSRLSFATSASLVAVALLSPIFGAIADFLGAKKRFLGISVAIGSLSTVLLLAVGPGDWRLALALFAIGNAALFLSFVFYDSLLPHVAHGEGEMDRASTAGYAIGYLGSALLLVALLFPIQNPEAFGLRDGDIATRVAFVVVGVWWALFSIPLFLRVSEPPRKLESDESESGSAGAAVRVALTRLRETAAEMLGDYRHAFLMLIAFMIYNEGIGTTIRMGGIYAASQNFETSKVITAILMIQFVGIPFAFLFGWLGPMIGTKRAILIGLVIYSGTSIYAYRMETITDFYVMAVLIALVQGGTQGLSRSLFASMVPKHKASEFFGFFSVFAKVAGIFGPLVFGLVIEATGSIRQAILSVIVFFIVGG